MDHFEGLGERISAEQDREMADKMAWGLEIMSHILARIVDGGDFAHVQMGSIGVRNAIGYQKTMGTVLFLSAKFILLRIASVHAGFVLLEYIQDDFCCMCAVCLLDSHLYLTA